MTGYNSAPFAMLKKFGEFELDESARRLSRGGQRVRLTGQALDLLCLLVERPGQMVSREEIQQALWPGSSADLEHSLDVLLNRLRTILGDSGKIPRYIETVPRRGYRFVARVETEEGPSAERTGGYVFRRVSTYVAVALLAAAIAVLFARTRYEKFVPQGQRPATAVPAASR